MNKKIQLYKLKEIHSNEGSIIKFINKQSNYFKSFGEVYFSTIKHNVEKKWRYHYKMHLNIIVINGEIEFYFYDEKASSSKQKKTNIICNASKPTCLSIAPKIWFKFRGLSKKDNILMNFSNILHDPAEYNFSDEIDDLWK